MACGVLFPVWVCWNYDISSLHHSGAVRSSEWSDGTKMVTLAQALQQCTIQSWMPPGMLCRAVQELLRCIALLHEKGDLLDITKLDVVEKDPVTPSIPTERASSPEQKSGPLEEEPTALPAPIIQEASEHEGAACPGKLALVLRRSLPVTLYWLVHG